MEPQVSITINEARDKHRRLQESIALLMLEFTRETGILIESVTFNLSRAANYNEETWYVLGRDAQGNHVSNQATNPYEKRRVEIKLKSPFDGVNT